MIAFLCIIVFGPIGSAILLAYLIGRGDGRRAEQRRRLTAANGIAALKNRQNSIRI